jgi:hypothetical protein
MDSERDIHRWIAREGYGWIAREKEMNSERERDRY